MADNYQNWDLLVCISWFCYVLMSFIDYLCHSFLRSNRIWSSPSTRRGHFFFVIFFTRVLIMHTRRIFLFTPTFMYPSCTQIFQVVQVVRIVFDVENYLRSPDADYNMAMLVPGNRCSHVRPHRICWTQYRVFEISR